MVRGARRMRGRRLIIINALIAQDFARVHVHAWTEHDPCIIQPHATCAGRRKQVDGAGCGMCMVVACACRDCMAARRKEAWCKSACGRTDLLLCGGAPVRCRGDVHGDATIPVYI